MEPDWTPENTVGDLPKTLYAAPEYEPESGERFYISGENFTTLGCNEGDEVGIYQLIGVKKFKRVESLE